MQKGVKNRFKRCRTINVTGVKEAAQENNIIKMGVRSQYKRVISSFRSNYYKLKIYQYLYLSREASTFESKKWFPLSLSNKRIEARLLIPTFSGYSQGLAE